MQFADLSVGSACILSCLVVAPVPVVCCFEGLWGGVKGAFGKIVDIISGPFKSAFNAISKFWNSTVGKLSFRAPDWVPGIGGKGFDMPKLPELAKGGIVTRATALVAGEGGEAEAIIPLSKIGQVEQLKKSWIESSLIIRQRWRNGCNNW